MPKLDLTAEAAYKPRLYKTSSFVLTATIESDGDDVVRVQRIADKVQPVMAKQVTKYEDAMKAMDAVLLKKLRELRHLQKAGKTKEAENARKDIADFKKSYDKVIVQYRGACERTLKKTISDAIAVEAKEEKEAKVTNFKSAVRVVLKLGSSILLGLLGAGVAAAGMGGTVATAGAGSVAGVSAIISGSMGIVAAALTMVKGIYTELMGLMQAEITLRDQVEDAMDDIDTKLRKHARHVQHGTKEDKTLLEKAAALLQTSDTKKLKDLVQRHKAKMVGVRQKADGLGKHLVKVLNTTGGVEEKMTNLAKELETAKVAKKAAEMKKLLKQLVQFRQKTRGLLERIPKVSQTLADGLAVDEKATQWVTQAQKTLPSSGPGIKLGNLEEPLKEVVSFTWEFVKDGLDLTVAFGSLGK